MLRLAWIYRNKLYKMYYSQFILYVAYSNKQLDNLFLHSSNNSFILILIVWNLYMVIKKEPDRHISRVFGRLLDCPLAFGQPWLSDDSSTKNWLKRSEYYRWIKHVPKADWFQGDEKKDILDNLRVERQQNI